MARVVVLALDADSAGQDAMLKAARLAAPTGWNCGWRAFPRERPRRAGARGGRRRRAPRRSTDSVPFVRFRVERALASGDATTPEGRDRTLEELRPVFATLPQSAMRLELTRLVAAHLDLPETRRR